MAGRPGVLVATFAFVLPIALALVALTYLARWPVVPFVVVPLLLVLIYLLPGHGERERGPTCPRCGREGGIASGTGEWSCGACGARWGPKGG